MINNLTSINLANLLRLMNCVSESLTICVRSFELWRRLRDLFEFSLLIAIFVGPASYIFLFCPHLRIWRESCATRRYSMDLTCGNRYLCVNCTTPFVNVDSIVFLNILRLGKRHAFGVWMIVLRKDHLKVKQILHKVEYAWNLTKYTESRLTKKLSCEIVF